MPETKTVRIKSQMTDQNEGRPASRLHTASVRVLPKRNESPRKHGTSLPRANEFVQQIAVDAQQLDSEHAPPTQLFSRAGGATNFDEVTGFEEEREMQPGSQRTVVTFSSQPWKSAPRKLEISPRGSQRLVPEADEMQVDNGQNRNSVDTDTPKKKASPAIKFSSDSSVPKTPSQVMDSGKERQSSPQSSMSSPLPLTQLERTPGTSDRKSKTRSHRPQGRQQPLGVDPQSPLTYIRPSQNPPSLADLRKTQLEHGVPQ